MAKKRSSKKKGKKEPNRYRQIIEAIFDDKYKAGMSEVPFERTDLIAYAAELEIDVPANLGDILYTFRSRAELPESIRETAPTGERWVIRGMGPGKYAFALTTTPEIVPTEALIEIKIPDATPGVIDMYALNDEQALLAKLRYNRLIDLFTGLTCYSLQNHLRTTVKAIGQLETDELYVGVDRTGTHHIIPCRPRVGVIASASFRSNRTRPCVPRSLLTLCAGRWRPSSCKAP